MLIKIFADFNNADKHGRVRLTTHGTMEDIRRLDIKLEPGMAVLLDDSDGLIAPGIVQFSEEEKIWVATIDWNDLR